MFLATPLFKEKFLVEPESLGTKSVSLVKAARKDFDCYDVFVDSKRKIDPTNVDEVGRTAKPDALLEQVTGKTSAYCYDDGRFVEEDKYFQSCWQIVVKS